MHGACTVSFEGGILIMYSCTSDDTCMYPNVHPYLHVYVLATKFNRNNTFALECTHHRILSNLIEKYSKYNGCVWSLYDGWCKTREKVCKLHKYHKI